MDQEKKFIGKWWVWVVFLLIVTGVVVTSINYIGMIGYTYMEKNIFEQSYQKHEADKTAITVYSAQLIQLRHKLNNPNITPGVRNELQAQINTIMVLKAGKED